MDLGTQRLDKFLANNGVCARRAVSDLLQAKIVSVNGKRALDPGVRLNPEKDLVRIDGVEIKKPKLVYYLLNKPKGYVSTTSDAHAEKTVTSLVPKGVRLYPVGRLDKETSGLIILTNDGEFTNLLTHPRFEKSKTYKLKLKGTVSEEQINKLQNGVELEYGLTSKAEAKIINSNENETILELTIHEGRNRQIRRMCEVLGLKLLELERIAIGTLKDSSLPQGKFRELTKDEVKNLKNDKL